MLISLFCFSSSFCTGLKLTLRFFFFGGEFTSSSNLYSLKQRKLNLDKEILLFLLNDILFETFAGFGCLNILSVGSLCAVES